MSTTTTKRVAEPGEEFRREHVRACALCGNGLAARGIPLFYRLRVETFALDPSAISRSSGLEQVMGGGRVGALLAHVMGPNEPLARRLAPTFEALVCQPCVMEAAVVPRLVEKDSAESAELERAEADYNHGPAPTAPPAERRDHPRIALGEIDPDA